MKKKKEIITSVNTDSILIQKIDWVLVKQTTKKEFQYLLSSK